MVVLDENSKPVRHVKRFYMIMGHDSHYVIKKYWKIHDKSYFYT